MYFRTFRDKAQCQNEQVKIFSHFHQLWACGWLSHAPAHKLCSLSSSQLPTCRPLLVCISYANPVKKEGLPDKSHISEWWWAAKPVSNLIC